MIADSTKAGNAAMAQIEDGTAKTDGDLGVLTKKAETPTFPTHRVMNVPAFLITIEATVKG